MELKQRTKIFVISLLATLTLLRLFLMTSPASNLYILGYNVHHLFIGAFLIIIMSVFFIFNIINKFTIVIAGVSSAFVLDEIIYLIATDGSDKAYLTQVSLLGAITFTAVILVFTLFLYYFNKQKVRQ